MQEPEIRCQIQDYMRRNLLVNFEQGIEPTTDLFEAGLIDSFGFVDLVAFLERTFGIVLSDDELGSFEMSTLAGISTLVSARLAAGSERGRHAP